MSFIIIHYKVRQFYKIQYELVRPILCRAVLSQQGPWALNCSPSEWIRTEIWEWGLNSGSLVNILKKGCYWYIMPLKPNHLCLI